MFRLGSVADPDPGYETYRGMLSIPYLNHKGEPVGMRFRCMRENCDHEYHGKYMSMEGDNSRTFNVQAIHAAHDEIHVAEGEFDAMLLTQIGMPAIAIPGVNLWYPRHRRMLAGFSRIFVWGDPDEAGAKFNRRLTKAMPRARVARLTDGDVSETYKLHGARRLFALRDGEE